MTPAVRGKPGARDRLVAAAEQLFYTDGIRAVGVDRLCAVAEVSKRSLYQHFGSKDEVIVAMLEARGEALRSAMGTGATPRERVLSVFDTLELAAADDGFRGCPFVGAATELKDATHPASVTARRHKEALTSFFEQQVREAGATDPAGLALQLTLLFDGASAYAVVRGGSTPATRRAVEIVLDAHGVS